VLGTAASPMKSRATRSPFASRRYIGAPRVGYEDSSTIQQPHSRVKSGLG
jgi:hypothetical protein